MVANTLATRERLGFVFGVPGERAVDEYQRRQERLIPVDEVYAAQEAFYTSASAFVMPVVEMLWPDAMRRAAAV